MSNIYVEYDKLDSAATELGNLEGDFSEIKSKITEVTGKVDEVDGKHGCFSETSSRLSSLSTSFEDIILY